MICFIGLPFRQFSSGPHKIYKRPHPDIDSHIKIIYKLITNPGKPQAAGTLCSTPLRGISSFTKFVLKKQEISEDFERISKSLIREFVL